MDNFNPEGIKKEKILTTLKKAEQGTMMLTFGDFIPVSSPTNDQTRN